MRLQFFALASALLFATALSAPVLNEFYDDEDPRPFETERSESVDLMVPRPRRFSIDEYGRPRYFTHVEFKYPDGTVKSSQFESRDSDSDSDDEDYPDSKFEPTDPERSIWASLKHALSCKLKSLKESLWSNDDVTKPALVQRRGAQCTIIPWASAYASWMAFTKS